VDLIEKTVASISVIALGLFTWKSTDGKADKVLMDERHETYTKAIDKLGDKQDKTNEQLGEIKETLASMGGGMAKAKGESDG
jgi:chaperonin cofactor prefoldin